MSLLFAAQALSNSSAAKAQSVAAVEAFVEGCELGSLKLPKSRGRVLTDKEVPPYADVNWWNRQEKRTVIEFVDPPSTYLIIADHLKVQPKGVVKSCLVLSRVIRADDAREAMLRTPPDVTPVQSCWSAEYCIPEWVVDLPKRGYRKRLRFLDDRSVVIQVDTYKSTAQ